MTLLTTNLPSKAPMIRKTIAFPTMISVEGNENIPETIPSERCSVRFISPRSFDTALVAGIFTLEVALLEPPPESRVHNYGSDLTTDASRK